MGRIPFTKMQGIGNDYIYIDVTDRRLRSPGALAKVMSDRHFGVGSDGLILIARSRKADFRMRMFNSDGSEAQMCGNGIRCLAKYVFERGLTDKRALTVETGRGVLTLELSGKGRTVDEVTVDMGEPILERAEIPMKGAPGQVVKEPLTVGGRSIPVTCVSMGNPHCIQGVDDLDSTPVETVGRAIEHHPAFPERTNVEFVKRHSRRRVSIRTWERGAGETLACGTGACAVCVAGVLEGVADRQVVADLLGGRLTIRWDADTNHVYMTGPAEFVFDGKW